MQTFYEQLASFYPLIYGAWEAAISRQAAQLDRLIQAAWGQAASTLLDNL